MMQNNRLLPVEYQQVHFLEERERAAYSKYNIDTLIPWANINEIEIYLEILTSASEGNICVVGGFQQSPFISFKNGAISSGLQNFTWRQEGNIYTTTFTTTNSLTLKIGAWSDIQWSGIYRYGVITLKGVNGILFNGVPCYRKSDNVAGFYDTIGKQFLINQGSETFIVGPDVN